MGKQLTLRRTVSLCLILLLLLGSSGAVFAGGIVFDRDYLGNTRGVGVLPGPFASADAAEKALW